VGAEAPVHLVQPRAGAVHQRRQRGRGQVVGQFDADYRTHDVFGVAHGRQAYALAASSAACNDVLYDALVSVAPETVFTLALCFSSVSSLSCVIAFGLIEALRPVA